MIRKDYLDMFEQLNPLLDRVELREGKYVIDTAGMGMVELDLLDKLIRLFELPLYFSTVDVLNRFIYIFAGGDNLKTIIIESFSFDLDGMNLTYRIQAHNSDPVEGKVELPNKVARIYLCVLLSGITTNIKVLRYQNSDFTYSLSNRELSFEVKNNGIG